MSYYDRPRRTPRYQPTRRLTLEQIQQIETTLQELQQEAAKWRDISQEWEATAREEHQRANRLEEQLKEQQNISYQISHQNAYEQVDDETAGESQELLIEAEEKINQLEENLVRAQADYENAKKRLEKRYTQQSEQDLMEFLRDLLPVLDNLDRAIEHTQAASNDEGIQLTRQLLLSTLDKYSVKPIQALGQRFNPEYHEALGTVEDSKYPPGSVAVVEQPGYAYRDKLLRPAQVLVTPD
jgi:molecular chaperone GrpE